MDAAPPARRKKPPKPAPILVPVEHTPYELSLDGTFREKDFEISRAGVRFGVPGAGMARSASGGDLAILGDTDLWLPASQAGAARPGEARASSGNGHSRNSSFSSEGFEPASLAGAVRVLRSPLAAALARPVAHADAVAAQGAFDVALRDLRVTGVIGRGGSGVVHSALHTPSGTLFALKVIPLDVREAVRKRIIAELRCLHASLDCPAIVPLHAAFLSEGSVAIVLEHMDRGSLAELLAAHGPLPEPHLRAVAARVLTGLCFLHNTLNIIHRDLKPSNLLLNSAGQVKISDFGVSGQLAHGRAESSCWLGTARYMAPERIGGGTYGFASDCWALGITLLECATGRFPYEASAAATGSMDFWELLECITEQAPPGLPADGPPFSAALHSFVDACLQKDAAARPCAVALAQHAWLAPAPGEDADGPGGAAGEALLAELVRDVRAMSRTRGLPPLREEAP